MQTFIEGSDAVHLFKDHAVNSLENYKVGQTKHLISCNKDGKVIGEGILLK
jgi:vanillate/3-O-methylgallate O-demethylase